ncbi:MAG TPA: LysR family transcriptional regulator [Steroidobacteraceae bacterium]|nr:LysR family transcriptional regulator [Steroidobacteraceae bacterium]
MSDRLTDLRLFTIMTAAGSLSETARRLNCSAAGISRRLAAMEARLGVRLVDRSSRRFALTQEGNLYHARALDILAALDRADAEVAARVKDPQGRLRVGVPLEIGRRRFASIIAQFTERYTNLAVELILSDSRLDVISDELDVLLHLDAPNDGSVVVRKLLTSRRAVCASPDYLARHGNPAAPGDLLRHDCICLVRGREVFDRWAFREGGKQREVRVHGRLTTNNAEVMHGWALLGRGICFKALWDVEDDLAEGRLVELLKPYASDDICLYATYATRRHLPSRVRVFIDFVATAMAAGDARLSR